MSIKLKSDLEDKMPTIELYSNNVRSLIARNEKLAAKYYHKGLQLAISAQIKRESDTDIDLDDLKIEPYSKHSFTINFWLTFTLVFLLFKIELFQIILIYIFDFVYLKFLAIFLINLFNQILCFDTPETIIY